MRRAVRANRTDDGRFPDFLVAPPLRRIVSSAERQISVRAFPLRVLAEVARSETTQVLTCPPALWAFVGVLITSALFALGLPVVLL